MEERQIFVWPTNGTYTYFFERQMQLGLNQDNNHASELLMQDMP